MSANSGTLPSTKGESGSIINKTTKSGFDHLDINKLYKGKSAEPAPKTVTQKHGMQTLGKAPPARRAGGTAVTKSESTDSSTNSAPPTPAPTSTPIPQQQQQQPPPGWMGHLPMKPPPPPPHNQNIPGVPLSGQPHLDKWTGGPQRGNGFPSQRFAQEFPSLEATGEQPVKGQIQNYSGPPPGTVTGLQSMGKGPDNQYGPGPILRPQTEGSWTQGGGMQRPPGPMQSQNAPSRDSATDRSNMGGPTPPPMSLGQAGPIPPPLGAYPMNFRGMHPPPPFMYQGSGPHGPGGFYPPGPGGIRYGMPIPPGSYPPGGHPGDGRRDDSGRGGRGPPQQNQMRPGSHFTSTSIIKKGEMERMDEIGTQEGGWASTNDAIDYNKKINFSDEEEGNREREKRPQSDRNEMKDVEMSEGDWERSKSDKQQSINEKDHHQHPRYQIDSNRPSRDHQHEQENEDDRNKRRGYEGKERGGDRGGRRPREEDWRSGNRYEEERKKGPPGPGRGNDPRGNPQDFPKHVAPRFQRQQHMVSSFNQPNQRQTPSPVSNSTTSTSGSGKDRDFRDWDRGDRDQQPYREPTYKILERRKTDSESSRDSKDIKRNQSGTEVDRLLEKDRGRGSRFGPSSETRGKQQAEDTKKSSYSNSNSIEKEANDLDNLESRQKEGVKREEAKTSFRTRAELSTSSWADEVEDEYSAVNEDVDLRKGSRDSTLEERERREPGPRRVYIAQRKVENFVAHPKSDLTPEQQKSNSQPKKEERLDEKTKGSASAWGEREKETARKDKPTITPDKEIEKSSSRDSIEKEKSRKDSLDKPKDGERHRDYDRHKDSDHHKHKEFDSKSKEHPQSNQREFPKQHRDNNKDVDRRERDRGDRNEFEGRGGGSQRDKFRRDRGERNERSDRDRKPAPTWNERDKVKQDKEDASAPIPHQPKEKTPPEDLQPEKDSKAKESKELDKVEKDEGEKGPREQRGTRNRERGGCAVYQARGGGAWGNTARPRGGGRGTGGSSGGRSNGASSTTASGGPNEKPTKKYDSDRDREEKENAREPSDPVVREAKKEKKMKDGSSVSSQESGGAKRETPTNPEDKTTALRKVSGGKEGDLQKKVTKSPSGSRRNGNPRGGSRLQGYGPPTDKNPFSSNNSSKPEEESMSMQPKEKSGSDSSHHGGKPNVVPPITSGPVPLMALGEISPPEMPNRSRHHGGGYGHGHHKQQHEGRSVPPRMRGGASGDPSYSSSFRGGANKRGGSGGNNGPDSAKPLMSINSNDLERGGSGEKINEGEVEGEQKKGTTTAVTQQKKENVGNKPYEARGRDMPPRFMAAQQQRESPPMQQQQPSAVGTGKPTSSSENSASAINNAFKDGGASQGNAWEKPITAALRPEPQSSLENKDGEIKMVGSSHGELTSTPASLLHPIVPPIGQGSGSGNCPPVQTMIFENTNFKSGGVGSTKYQDVSNSNKVIAPAKIPDGLKGKKPDGPPQSQGLEMSSKEFPFGEDTPQLDFGSSFSDPPTSSSAISSHSQVYKSGLMQSSRAYGGSHQSPISPLAADLNEKIQSVKSYWDVPTMPIVAEQGGGNQCGAEEDSLSGSFGSDAFKRPDSRDYGQSLQQTSTGFAPGPPPAISAIAKPDSRSSPSSVNVRQIKPPQGNQMDPQMHSTVSSSPFAYGLAQQHQASNTFGIRAVPSPPSAMMYGSSHTPSNPNAVYQAFPPHVDTSQVVGSNPRSQFPQYSNQVGNAGGAPQYMSGSLFLPLFENYNSLQSYQAQQHHHPQQPHGIPTAVQVQSQNSRSPGPMPMTSASAGVVGGSVMMNSNASSLINLKSGGSVQHGNIGHQVHPGTHQQGYSQFGHPHMPHPQQHHLGPVGHQKQGYSQPNMPPQNPQQHMGQMFVPYDQNQHMGMGQNSLYANLQSGHRGGPPPSATPPIQGLPSSTPFYGSPGIQSGMYPGATSQGGNIHVPPGSQGLQNLRMVQQNTKKKWNSKPHYS